MRNLWAPWRMEFIMSPREEGCFLCEAAEPGDEARKLVVCKSDLSAVVVNKFPYNNGHLLVAPKRHESGLEGLSDEELADLFRLVRLSCRVLNDVMGPQGMNLGVNMGEAAGAGVPEHLHVHIVPRWKGDTNFMPVVADTKVIPQALGEVYARLREGFKRASERGGE